MRFLLDTCVLSELVRPTPETKVLKWLDSAQDCYLSSLTIGELQKGIEVAADEIRKQKLQRWLAEKILKEFESRILGINVEIARTWGSLQGNLQKVGLQLPVIDGLLAATAKFHQLTFVTRNHKDFERTGVALFNPWS